MLYIIEWSIHEYDKVSGFDEVRVPLSSGSGWAYSLYVYSTETYQSQQSYQYNQGRNYHFVSRSIMCVRELGRKRE